MRHTNPPAYGRLLLACAAATTVALTACSSNHSASHSSSSSPSPTPSPSATLDKAAFIAQADPICTKIDAALTALPQPASEQDYATLSTDTTSTIALFQSYVSTLQPLVNQTADASELNAKWLTPEKQDFARAQTVLVPLLAALKAKNSTQIAALGNQLKDLPDHSKDFAAYLTSYGLTGCAKLETDNSSG